MQRFALLSSYPPPFEQSTSFDIYWRFAAERSAIFRNRLQGHPVPWTSDPVLQRFKFTNVYRLTDRTSQFLISNVIYSNNYPTTARNILFRILLFKLFNKIETWRHLEKITFPLVYHTNFDKDYCTHLDHLVERGTPIFSGAYIAPPPPSSFKSKSKHQAYLGLLKRLVAGSLPHQITQAASLKEVYSLLISHPMIGKFLAYQFAIDINYSPLTNFDENEFVVAGPGASRGIAKCIANKKGLTEAQIIRWMVENQDAEFARLGLKFEPFLGRKLHLIDCQNLFCEVDKYLRVARPDIQLHDRPMRIKQKFRPNLEPIDYMLPPKWVSKSQIAPRNEME